MARSVPRHAGVPASCRDAGYGGFLGARFDARALRAFHTLAAVHAGRTSPDLGPSCDDRRDCAGNPLFSQLVAACPLGERSGGNRGRQGVAFPGTVAAALLSRGAAVSRLAAAHLDRRELLYWRAAAQRGRIARAIRLAGAAPP